MNSGSAGILVLGVIGLALAAAVFVGVLGGSTETSFPAEVPFDAIPTDGTAIVFAKAQEGGIEVIGVRLQRPSHTIDVALSVPPECVEVDESGTEQLRHDGTCGELPVSGEIVGGGTTAAGDRIVSVRIGVQEACAEAVPFGSVWPSDRAECGHG